LNLRAPGDDRKRIGQNCPAAYVERGERLTFFIERALADDVN
jgi:hypothetical protein